MEGGKVGDGCLLKGCEVVKRGGGVAHVPGFWSVKGLKDIVLILILPGQSSNSTDRSFVGCN